MNNANLNNAIASEGCVITEATINNSLVGLRSIVESGTYLDGVICMGADFYETIEEKEENARAKRPNVGIGKNCRIKKCIIDKNVRIGDNCSIGHTGKAYENGEHEHNGVHFYVADDIIIVPKNTIIPEGTIF